MAEKNLGKISEIKNSIKQALSFSDESKSSFDKDFYKDVDRLKNRGCCTLPIVIGLLVVVFGVLVYGLIYLKNYTHSGIDFLAKNSLNNQMDLRDRFVEKSSSLAAGEALSMDFSEVEVAAYLGLADPDFPLKKANLKIDERGIILNGKISESLFALPIEAVVKPKISEGKLTLVLEDIATSSISLPKFARDKIASYLDLIMRSKGLYDQNLELISVSTSEKNLKLDVQRKIS